MRHVVSGSIVCGYAIYGYETSAKGPWSKEFPANMIFQANDKDLELFLSVYSSPKGIFISTVGRYSDPNNGT